MTAPAYKLTQYEKHYSWSHRLGENCIAHKDGAVSIMISWDGLDSSLLTQDQRLSIWANFYLMLNSLSEDYCYEFHFFRQHNSELAKRYIEKNKDLIRAEEFSAYIRTEHARHLSSFSRKNSVAVVLTRLPSKNPFSLFAKANLLAQSRKAQDLVAEAAKLSRNLEGARLASFDEYFSMIHLSLKFNSGDFTLPKFHPHLLLPEQVIKYAPFVADNLVKVGNSSLKVLLVYMYPNTSPGWFNQLSEVPADIHIS
ncbi:MAG: hypothetical protein GY941_30220, partial [Planctomycetes bacterium]|nr:hypothetical protein [Planctomycetota bacterium]